MFMQLPVVAFTCAVLVLVPLPWHWRAGNISTIAICAWLFVSNVLNGVDAILWGNTVENFAPVWCDISTKLQIGSTVALPAAMLCLCIHLERIASVRQVSITRSEKRRRQVLDGALCFIVPVVYMALHYIVQGHRFDIVEGFGCRPTVYESIASIFLIWLPPLMFSIAGCVYAALSFAHFWRRRATFAKHLQNSNSSLSTNRYFRLMSMATLEMFIGILITSIDMWFSIRPGLRPWVSWQNVHSNWLEVAYFPLFLVPRSTLVWVFVIWVQVPISSILFFGFFAFGRDAMIEFSATLAWFRRKILRLRALNDDFEAAPASFGNPISHKLKRSVLDLHLAKVQESYPPSTPCSTESFETSPTPPSLPYSDSHLDTDQVSTDLCISKISHLSNEKIGHIFPAKGDDFV